MATKECKQARQAPDLMTRMRESFTHSPGDSDSEKGCLEGGQGEPERRNTANAIKRTEDSQGAENANTGNTGMYSPWS